MAERNHGEGLNYIRTALREQDPDWAKKAPRRWDNVQIRIEYSEYGTQLYVDMDDERFTWGQGVLLEVWQGELRAIVWSDPESEDPTHTIPIMPLSSASESFQKEYADDISDKE